MPVVVGHPTQGIDSPMAKLIAGSVVGGYEKAQEDASPEAQARLKFLGKQLELADSRLATDAQSRLFATNQESDRQDAAGRAKKKDEQDIALRERAFMPMDPVIAEVEAKDFESQVAGIFGGKIPDDLKEEVGKYVEGFSKLDPNGFMPDGKTRQRDEFKGFVTSKIANDPRVLNHQKNMVGDFIEEFLSSEAAALVPGESKMLGQMMQKLQDPNAQFSKETLDSIFKAYGTAQQKAVEKYQLRVHREQVKQSITHVMQTPGLGDSQRVMLAGLLGEASSAVQMSSLDGLVSQAAGIAGGLDVKELSADKKKDSKFQVMLDAIKGSFKDLEPDQAVSYMKQIHDIVYGPAVGGGVGEGQAPPGPQAGPSAQEQQVDALLKTMGADPNKMVTVSSVDQALGADAPAAIVDRIPKRREATKTRDTNSRGDPVVSNTIEDTGPEDALIEAAKKNGGENYEAALKEYRAEHGEPPAWVKKELRKLRSPQQRSEAGLRKAVDMLKDVK